ncbi:MULTISPECIES: DMT family transporter [unclassified Streptomyces]|uniref:DMT family transporter n=1 Tax=unclassified Streptomyces TaxID=2593676 RepID=UPI0015E182C2|nr:MULTISPECIES: DMT family transporter [unclassified Streptomyces]
MKSLGWAGAFVVLWSSGFVGAVLAQPAGSVTAVLAWRYLVTALVLVAVVLVVRRRPVSAREVVRQGVIGLLAHVVFLGGVFGASAGGVGAGTVALVCALQPMLVTVAGRVGWGDAVRRRQVVGLLTGLGAVVLSVGGTLGVGGAGLLLAVASLFGLSGAALLERRWRPETDVVTSLCVQVVVSAGVFLAFAAATGGLGVTVTPAVIGALVWLVLLSGLGGYAAFVVCLRRLGSTTTSLLLYLTPPVTTVWAWGMFEDVPGRAQALALLLGAAAVFLAWPRTPRGRAADGIAPRADGPRRAAVPG